MGQAGTTATGRFLSATWKAMTRRTVTTPPRTSPVRTPSTSSRWSGGDVCSIAWAPIAIAPSAPDISTATDGFWQHVLAILAGIVWPAVAVYHGLDALGA